MRKSATMIFIILTVFMLNVGRAKASGSFYVNENGISFSQEEYDFFSKMYYEGYQKYMTQDDLEYFKYCDMDINNIRKVEYEPATSYLMSTYYETTAKKITITNAGGGVPTIVVTLVWKGSPRIRSYDLMGAYLSDTNLAGDALTRMTYSGGSAFAEATKYTSNGFGASVKLPNSGSNIVVSQTFNVKKSGRVYASYQHAKSSLTLANSQTFDTKYSGLGNVFYFSSSNIRNKYDAMGGVSMSF